jgi:AcrR family transcriptional regulator
MVMSKGDRTRQSILDEALAQATKLGFEGLSLGDLAKDAGMSKSGLYAHFASKEDLQLQVLKLAAERFIAAVIHPAWARPKGEGRIRALFELWFDWSRSSFLPGGCIFVAAANELDDRPGPVRDHLVEEQRRWLGTVAKAFNSGVETGQFRRDLDCDQMAYEFDGILLAYHHFSRLLRLPEAETRARRAFEALIDNARIR